MSIRKLLSPETKDNRREFPPTRVEQDRVWEIDVAVGLLGHALREMGVHTSETDQPRSNSAVQVDFEAGAQANQPVVDTTQEFSQADIEKITRAAQDAADRNDGIGEEFGHAEKAA